MAKEMKSKYAILGMLSMSPMSGYALKKAIEQSIANFWNESYGQIYPILKQLQDEELATSHAEKQEGKPERYVYTITDRGRQELRRWLTEPIEYAVERNELLLKLFFGKQGAVVDNIKHVLEFRNLQLQLFHKYRDIEAHLKEYCAHNPDLSYQLITVRYGRHHTQAFIDWCDETLNTLNELANSENSHNLRQ